MLPLFLIAVAASSQPTSEPSSQPSSAPLVSKPPALSASFGHGVVFSMGKDVFELGLRARIQFRFSHTEPGADGASTRTNEFIIRRARIQLDGTFLTDFKLKMQLGLAPRDMEADAPNPLRDAQISYTRLRDLSVRLGQGKVQFDRHRLTSSSALIFPERADVMTELTLDRDVGAELYSNDLFGLSGRLSYALGVWGGDGRNRFAPNSGLLYAARVQVLPFGDFDVMPEGDHTRDRRFRMAIGLAGARNVDTVRTRSTTGSFFKLGGFSYWHATADLVMKWRGVYLLAAGFMRLADIASRTGTVGNEEVTEWSRSALGAFAQAAVMTCDYFELMARYGFLEPFGLTDPNLLQAHQLGGGMNFYTGAGHNLKLSVEYDFAGNARFVGTHTVRVQAQMYF